MKYVEVKFNFKKFQKNPITLRPIGLIYCIIFELYFTILNIWKIMHINAVSCKHFLQSLVSVKFIVHLQVHENVFFYKILNKYWRQYFWILNVTSISLTKSFNLEIDDKKKILPENILIKISHPNFFWNI